MDLEHRRVRGRRGVEGHAVADPLQHPRHRRLVGPGRDEATARDLEPLAHPSAAQHAGAQLAHDDLVHVATRAEAVEADAVADLAGHAQHRGPDGGEGHRHHGLAGGSRSEVGRHQRERVVLPAEVERLARLPAPPDGAQGSHVLPQPGRRRAPRDAEPLLVVRAHLRAEPEHEPPARGDLQVPGRVRHGHRAARERDRDAGAERHPRGAHGRHAERQEGVVPVLGGDQAVEPGRLCGAGRCRDLGEVLLGQDRQQSHGAAVRGSTCRRPPAAWCP